MLLRHPGEQGICIDHWAALVLNGDGTYKVLSLKGKAGSLMKGKKPKMSETQEGTPCIWIKNVKNGKVEQKLCPSTGKVSDLLKQAKSFVDDPLADKCRK